MHSIIRPATASAFVSPHPGDPFAAVLVEAKGHLFDMTLDEARAFIEELQAAADELEVMQPIDLVPTM